MPHQPTLPGTKHVAPHSRRGKSFERELDALHDAYRLNGVVDIVKNAEGWSFIFPDKFNQKKLTSPGSVATTAAGDHLEREFSNVDYSGGNDRGAFIFDAKETAEDRFPLKSLKPEQFRRLKASARCRTTAGVMIMFTAHRRVFFLPVGKIEKKFEQWDAKRQLKVRAKPGEGSLSIEEMEKLAVEIKQNPGGQWDWYAFLKKEK